MSMQSEKIDTLGDALPREQARVRRLLEQYIAIGPAGAFGAAMMRQSLARAEQAAISGDVIAMLQAHEDLKTYTG
jgi:hypothetical protein